MKKFKFLIIMPYFNRPNMVREGLKNLLRMSYDNWHLGVIDDGSDKDKALKPILEEIFGEENRDKYTLYETNDTLKMKLKRGSTHGLYMNKAMKEIPADYAVMLSDDDGFHVDYLAHLNEFYNMHGNTALYSYSHVIGYDPFTELPNEDTLAKRMEQAERGEDPGFATRACRTINDHTGPVHGTNTLDSTQVSWHVSSAVERGCLFLESTTRDLDADFYAKCFAQLGPCVFNRGLGAYKAFHDDQLGNRFVEGTSLYVVRDKEAS
tara:strand:+ start:33676 stop:34470 length:795 start_codon:yes stop_codon:yes gene_type:complete